MRRLAIGGAVLGLGLALGACASSRANDVGLEGLNIDRVDPGVVVPAPGRKLVTSGQVKISVSAT